MSWQGQKRRTLQESDSYRLGFERLGDPKKLDDALLLVTEAIAYKAEVFDLVRPLKLIRLAHTEPYLSPDGVMPGLRVWFRIMDEDTVTLLYIEEHLPGE